MMKTHLFLSVVVCFFVVACQNSPPIEKPVSPAQTQMREIASPAGNESGEPEIFAAPDGKIILSWLEKIDEKKHALKFSILNGETWNAPQTIIEAENLLVNWADFPSVISIGDNNLAAHWLVKNPADAHAYDVFMSRSADNGKTWAKSFSPHNDKTATEHGFVSLFRQTDGKLGVIWLDGRKYAKEKAALDAPQFIKIHNHEEHQSETMLRFANVDDKGVVSNETELDGRVCDCCQTAAIETENGAVVMYRDRLSDETRDFSIVRRVNDEWSEPKILHADNWVINGCPVNGAALAANKNRIAAAWFTAANDQPEIKIAFSGDAGENFAAPIKIDDGAAIGRVDVVALADDSAVVSWIAGSKDGANIKIRRVKQNGEIGEIFTVAPTSINRASGFPRLANVENKIFIAWTEGEKPSRVRTATLEIK